MVHFMQIQKKTTNKHFSSFILRVSVYRDERAHNSIECGWENRKDKTLDNYRTYT